MERAQREPSHAELTSLVREHAARVRRVLARRGVAAADVPDAEQEVFIVAQRKLAQFEGRSSLATWLVGIAANVASQHRKQARHRREQLGIQREPASEALDPLARLQAIESVRRVRELLDALSPEQRDVIVLHELTELSMREVARELDVPLKTAFSRLYAGHRALRRALRRSEQAQPSARARGRIAAALGFVLGLRWLPRAHALAALTVLCAALGAPAEPHELVLAGAALPPNAVERLLHRESLPLVLGAAKPPPLAPKRAVRRAPPAPADVSSVLEPPRIHTELTVFRSDGDYAALPYPHPFAERAFTSVDPARIKPRIVRSSALTPHAACGQAHAPCAL
jgi:RNA polymerase sigma-70 factor (ECF subfamily)